MRSPACARSVHEGVPIAQPLLENEIFPPMVAQMVKIGEETGELEKMLAKIADFYEDEVDASVAVAHLDRRADHDDRRRHHGRHHHHLDVPADVQDADARQVVVRSFVRSEGLREAGIRRSEILGAGRVVSPAPADPRIDPCTLRRGRARLPAYWGHSS